jgi:hypothetical protein
VGVCAQYVLRFAFGVWRFALRHLYLIAFRRGGENKPLDLAGLRSHSQPHESRQILDAELITTFKLMGTAEFGNNAYQNKRK